MQKHYKYLMAIALVFSIHCVQAETKSANKFQNKEQHFAGQKVKVEQTELNLISAKIQQHFGLGKTNEFKESGASNLRQSLESLQNRPANLTTVQRRSFPGSFRVHWNTKNGTPANISGTDLSASIPDFNLALSASEISLRFIESHLAAFKLNEPRNELKQIEMIHDKLGKQHITFHQIYKGVPVWGKSLVTHFDSDGKLYSMNARYAATPVGLDLNEVQLSNLDAILQGKNDLANSVEIIEFDAFTRQILKYDGPQTTRYIWYDANEIPHLVWHVQIRPNLRDNWYYFIEAHTGDILEKYNATAFDGPTTGTATDLNGVQQTINVYEDSGTFYMIDASRPIFQTTQPNLLNDPKGALWTIDLNGTDLNNEAQLAHVTSGNNSWNDAVSVSAHANVGEVFSYFFNTHNRQAIDGNASTIISIIHVTSEGQPMDNAFWNGVAMAYGDGNQAFTPLAGALDVAAHEMTHGVIQNTVNLEYKFQSGALNESLADVFGVMVDRADWKLGEDVVKPAAFPSGALRDMQDPHNGGSSLNDPGWQPAHMNEFLNLTIDQDNGGVHVNSGIPNKACQLIGDAIGKTKTEQIYYRVMDARYLNSQSNFVDMRLAAIRAATDLFGDAEVNAVKAGFDGVGIVGNEGTPEPEDTPAVEGEEWIAVVNADGFDNSLFLVKPVIQNESTDIVQLTTTQVFTDTGNPISVSDDGSVVLFVDNSNFIRAIFSNGAGEEIISSDGVWKSIALSPDGNRLAATTDPNIVGADSTIYIFDFVNSNNNKVMHLYAPTTVEGINNDITLFADALDWDLSGSFVLYDAFNSIPQSGGSSIDFWDVNVLDVDNELIFSVFGSLPDGVNIGNPSFSQTNDNFFVFDLFDNNDNSNSIMAVDLFNGTVNEIENNGASLGYPRYSSDDSRVVFEKIESGVTNLRQIPIAASKIEAAGASEAYVSAGQRPTWFAVGQRFPTSVESENTSVPESFNLAQNFPNPFNPETTIRYELPVDADISLSIYDISGRLVTTLENAKKTAGQYTSVWAGRNENGARVASGIYFYRLEIKEASGKVSTLSRKMTLLK